MKYAGCRSSNYGARPFPNPEGWENACKKMASHWSGSTPAAIWIIGTVPPQPVVSEESSDGNKNRVCLLEFPGDGNGPFDYTRFSNIHENYLNYFDKHGIKVWLQVEPGFADVNTLIDLVLSRYKHHPCVIGFGVDVEWYKYDPAEDPWGVRVTDAEAKAWEKRVKSHNEDYTLFLKHWRTDWMPPTYRGDIVFVNDGQELDSLNMMVSKFKAWADCFASNTVMYQYGYESDKPWWSKLNNPSKDIGDALDDAVSNDVGAFWVDFTLRDMFPESFKTE